MSKDHVSFAEVYDLQREVERRADHARLHVEFKSGIPTAYTDGKSLVFPMFSHPLSIEDYVKLKGMSIHEPLHVKRKELFKIAEEKGFDFTSKIGMLTNAIEDEIMEHEHCRFYHGDKLDLDNLANAATERAAKIVGSGTVDWTEEVTKLHTLRLILCRARYEWAPSTKYSHDRLRKVSQPEAIALADKLERNGWVDKLNQIGPPKMSYELACDLYRELFDDDPDSEEAKRSNADGEGEGNGKQGEGKGEGAGERAKVKWSDLTRTVHSEEESKQFNLGIDYSGKTSRGNWIPYPKDKVLRIDSKTARLSPTYPVERLRDTANAAAFANQLKRLLIIETRSDWESERKSGKISKRNIHRVAMPMRGDGEWNSRIFQRRTDKRRLDTCVTLLVDWSGSMSGSKMNIAAAAACRLNDVFSKVLRIPMQIESFTENGGNLVHATIKGFNELAVPDASIVKRFSDFTHYTSGNSDADSIMESYYNIKQRPEKRKIIVVLSDGSPSDGHHDHATRTWTDPDAALMACVKNLTKARGVELYGIGICDESVTRYYGQHAKVVNNLDELDRALLDTLHNVIIKHGAI